MRCAGASHAASSCFARARARSTKDNAALMRRLITRPKVSDLFGQAGREWLASLELPSEERETVTSSLRQIDFLTEEIEQVSA